MIRVDVHAAVKAGAIDMGRGMGHPITESRIGSMESGLGRVAEPSHRRAHDRMTWLNRACDAVNEPLG